jgi:spore coat protein U-like protein
MLMRRMALLAVPFASLLAHDADAQQTATLTVTAQVVEGCSIDGATLNFGQYISGQPGKTHAKTDLTVTCPSAVELTFSDGQNGNSSNRGMKRSGGSDVLKYQLYINGQEQVVAGGLAGGPGAGRAVNGSASPQKVSIYGTIAGNQALPIGTYQDTVTVFMTLM